MLKTNKLNGLIATYRDGASSDSEAFTAKRIACKLIEKELGCKRWVSSNIVHALADGEVWFTDCQQATIIKYHQEPQNIDVVAVFADAIKRLGFSVNVGSKNCYGKNNSYWSQQVNVY